MLLLFVIVLLMVGLAIVSALYSLFVPFFQQLTDIRQYNIVYYGAVSSLERGMSSLRYHGPGFEGGQDEGDFVLGDLEGKNTSREVTSRTNQIPKEGKGNVPYALVGNSSSDYNVLGPQDLMEYSLSMDDSEVPYPKGAVLLKKVSNLKSVSLYARLPKMLYDQYSRAQKDGKLPVNCSVPEGDKCDVDKDRINKDLVIDWSLEGKDGNRSFRIVPRVDVDYSKGSIKSATDTLIRENHVNETSKDSKITAMWGGTNNKYNPVNSSKITKQNIIGARSNFLSSSFGHIFEKSKDLKLLLGLARDLKTKEDKMYPFLETQIKANKNIEIPDLFYHLEGSAEMGEYSVTLKIKKPTSDRSLLGSFTIVF